MALAFASRPAAAAWGSLPARQRRPVSRLRPRSRLPSVSVQANELNKWANRDGPDERSGLDDNGFERDSTLVIVRVLTSRAVQRVLLQLHETDGYQAKWLSDYCAQHPPLEGDAFVMHLLAEPPVHIRDVFSGSSHYISPATLANRVLATREDLAKSVSQGLNYETFRSNVEVLRRHLESHTYTSGTHDGKSRGGRLRTALGKRFLRLGW